MQWVVEGIVNDFDCTSFPITEVAYQVSQHKLRLSSDWCGHMTCFTVSPFRYHDCPDNDNPQHHCPEVTPQGLLRHSDGPLCICLLHIRLLRFGGVWYPALFCQQPETKQRQRQKEEKPCTYHFPLGPLKFLCRKITRLGFGLVLLSQSVG